MKIFIAGPRAVRVLPQVVADRMTGLVGKGAMILVGDANGVDYLVQQLFSDINYRNVTVYASNGKARNNIGNWSIKNVPVDKAVTGFDFYAQKDLKMAEDTDYGFMIWNGKSKGTLNNMVNLVNLSKEVLAYFIPHRRFYKVNSMGGVYELASLDGEGGRKALETLTTNKSASTYEQVSL